VNQVVNSAAILVPVGELM